MKKLLLSGFMAIAMVVGVNAQKSGYDPVKAPFGHGEDSVNCRLNLSLMQTSAKAEAYDSALKPWMDVYESCPASSKNIYIYGPRIFKALYETATDAAKKKEYLDKTLEIYDTRIKYFGEDDSMVAEVIDNTTSRGRTLRFLYDGPHEEFKKALYALGAID